MKLVIERAALLAALDATADAAAREDTIPILQNVMLEAQQPKGGDGALMLTATDMDRAIVAKAPADIQTPGGLTVPAKMLRQIVSNLEDGAQVGLEADADGTRVRLRSGRSNFAMPALPVDDFPKLTWGDFPHKFEIEAPDARRMFGVPAYAISTEETRFYLCGILLEPSVEGRAKHLCAVAVDGHLLCRLRVPLPKGAANMPRIIVPHATVRLLTRLLKDAKAPIDFAVSDTRIRVTIGDVVLTSKLIDGTFPDWARVVPQDPKIRIDLPVKPARAALKRMLIVAGDKDRTAIWKLSKGAVHLESNHEGRGATEEIAAGFSGEPVGVAYNCRQIVEILDQVAGDDVVWRFADPKSPALIVDESDPDVLHVVTPINF